MCSTALDQGDIFPLQLNISIEVRLELPMLSVAALAILVATEAYQVVHICALANGNDGRMLDTAGN